MEITVKADTVTASSSATDSGRNGGASVFYQKSQTAERQAQQKQELDKRVSGQKEGDYSGCGAAASGDARLLHLAVSLLPSDATPPRPVLHLSDDATCFLHYCHVNILFTFRTPTSSH